MSVDLTELTDSMTQALGFRRVELDEPEPKDRLGGPSMTVAATETAPYFVLESGDKSASELFDTPWHEEFLAWARSQSIVPENVSRIEVRAGENPRALLAVFDLDENGLKIVDEVKQEFVKHEETVTLTALPPLPCSV